MGHNGTPFSALQNIEIGDIVGIDTSYGKYTYEVNAYVQIHVDEFDVTQLENDDEYLIMNTCYPFNVIKMDQRYFVYAKKIKGPQIKVEEKKLKSCCKVEMIISLVFILITFLPIFQKGNDSTTSLTSFFYYKRYVNKNRIKSMESIPYIVSLQ